MSKIERRRNRRILNLILFAALAVIAIGGIVVLIVFFAGSSCQKTPGPETAVTEAPAPTEAVDYTQAPVLTPAPVDDTDDPGEPIRISDEQSAALLTLACEPGYDMQGRFSGKASGSMALSFVNNTDRTLYSASFAVGGADISLASVNGAPVRFTLSEGMLTIPFVNELPVNSSFDIYFAFTASTDEDDTVELPRIAYDTSFLLTAFIDSKLELGFTGCEAQRTERGRMLLFTVPEQTVREVKLKFRH